MQALGLNRKPNRFANPERDLRVDTRNGYPGISETCFKDDFRTQLLNHFDIGVEAALRNVATERKMFGPHTHQYLFAPPASQRPIVCRWQSEPQRRCFGGKTGPLLADLHVEEIHCRSPDEACDKSVRRVAIDLERRPPRLTASIHHHN